MEITNDSRPMLIDGLSCVCGGSKIYYSTVNVEDMSNINQLACPNCGIIMRSPSTDENGEWLKKHWEKTHGIVKTLTAERDEYKRRAAAAEADILDMLIEEGGNLDLCHWCAGNCPDNDYSQCEQKIRWRGPCTENGGSNGEEHRPQNRKKISPGK